jgi:hypothetical protein
MTKADRGAGRTVSPAVRQTLEKANTSVEGERRGRKPAKHSNPDYVQTSLYLPRQLKNTARARLLEQGKELSGLVEEMLRDWLKKQA